MAYLPVFLNSSGLRCLVVGGGGAALRKVAALADAEVTTRLVAVEVAADVAAACEKHGFSVVRRSYRESDLHGCNLVFACTNDARVQETVTREARRAGALICAADEGGAGDLILGATFRRGDVQVAVSTAGVSPTLARHLRARLEGVVGSHYACAAQVLGRVRAAARGASGGGGPTVARVAERILEAGLIDALQHRDRAETIRLLQAELGAAFDNALLEGLELD